MISKNETKHYQINLKPTDSEKLEDLAEYYAISKSSVIKMLISQKHRELKYELKNEY